MRNSRDLATLVLIPASVLLALAACNCDHDEQRQLTQNVTTAHPVKKNVITTHSYACRIYSLRHVEVRASHQGYLAAVNVKEGQTVKAGDVMYEFKSVGLDAKPKSKTAESHEEQVWFNRYKKLVEQRVLRENEAEILDAEQQKFEADLQKLKEKGSLATIKAPFSGIVGHLYHELGNLVEEGCKLMTLSDNSRMRVYFNIPANRDFRSTAGLSKRANELTIELVLANGVKFGQLGNLYAIGSGDGRTTENTLLRADVLNPDRVLYNGQTAKVMVTRAFRDAIVIPQCATFRFCGHLSVFVVDNNDVVHRCNIAVEDESEDFLIVEKGVSTYDRIIVDGAKRVADGQKVQYAYSAQHEAI